MPTRVVTSGVGDIPGKTMFEKRLYFMKNLDYIREWLMFEPRGHSAMSGAILQKPTRPDADWGVVILKFLAAFLCAATAPSGSQLHWLKKAGRSC